MLKDSIDRMGVAAVIAITVAGYFGGIRPVVAHQTARLLTEREIAVKRQKFDEMRETLGEAEEVVSALQDDVGTFRASFDASPRVNERIGELAELAEVAGVAVDSIRPGEPQSGEGFRSQPVAITGTGNPGSIATLLSRLRVVFPDMGARGFVVSGQVGDASALSAELVWFTGSDDQNGSDTASSK